MVRGAPSSATPPLSSAADERVLSLERLVGNTPMLELRFGLAGAEHRIYAKYEIANFTGSIKDRMALFMLRRAYAEGRLAAGDTIVEASSGNTGISFAAIGRALGHPVRITMPDWMSRERTLLIESFGATVVPVSAAEGGFRGAIALADTFADSRPDVFRPRQFDSAANVEAHRATTGPEILAQLAAIGRRPTAFVAGVGTGGTVMGAGLFLKERVPGLRAHPLEPSNSPTLRTGEKRGHHRIQGISDEFVPSIVVLDRLDRIVDVRDGDAIRMARRIASVWGIGVGISAGANVLGALQIAREEGPESVVATVIPDSNKKYLSTDLCRAEPPAPGDLTDEIELCGVRVLPRLALPADA